MKKTIRMLAFVAAFVFLYACNDHPLIVPQYADLRTENVIIRAVDDDWVIRQGDVFKPQEANILSIHAPFPANLVETDLSAYDKRGYRNYVQDVVVEVGGKEKLYGKILFFRVFDGTKSSSAKRKWTVAVPGEYLQAAREGNVAVVYQPYLYNERDWASWVLWMSSMPL